jgi:hypothetical protein
MNLPRFLISVIDDGSVVDGPGVMPAIDAFNEKLRTGGHWIFAWGLHGPSHSTVIDNRANAGQVHTGPLVEHNEGDEYISGLWIIQAESKDQAMALAHEASFACNRKVEVRPFH